ncbi:MAG: FlgD immunoglobulin-like domain containing protein, partial [Candidatus Eisenbacteria bacterium]
PNWSGLSNVPGGTTSPVPDTTPPAAVTTLSTCSPAQTSVTLDWTAVGDDGTTGTASAYDIRYSTSPITAADFGAATPATGEPAPKAAGQAETFALTGLTAGTTYYFAMKVRDEVYNWSDLSNGPICQTEPLPDTTPPAAVISLAAAATTQTSVTLSWTAVGDDGMSGTAAQYDLRYSRTRIRDGNWAWATQATGEPIPCSPGHREGLVVTGLTPGQRYYFALKVADEVPNWGAMSKAIRATTLTAGSGFGIAGEIVDESFETSDWAAGWVGGETPPGDLSAILEAGGAGPFAQVSYDPEPGAGAVAVYLYQPISWNPDDQGEVRSLDVGLDYRSLNGAPAWIGVVVQQGATGEYFAWVAAESVAVSEWTPYEGFDLTAESFVSISAEGGHHPDFGAGAGEIRFGFVIGPSAEGSGPIQGGVDNWWVAIHAEKPPEADSPASPVARLLLRESHPNPFSIDTRIEYVLPEEGRVSLRLFDTAGRLVRTLVDGNRPAGEHVTLWDGRDDRGWRVGSGVYYCILDARGRVERNKVCVIE